MPSKLREWVVTYRDNFYTKLDGVSRLDGSWTNQILVSATNQSVAIKKANSRLKKKYANGGRTYFHEWEVIEINERGRTFEREQ